MKQTYKTVLLWVFLILLFIVIYKTLPLSNRAGEINWYTFLEKARNKEISEIQIQGNEISGKYTKDNKKFFTRGPKITYSASQYFFGQQIKMTFKKEDQNSFWLSILSSWVPMIFLFLIFFFFMRQLQTGGGKAMSFGKSRHRTLADNHRKVTFDDVAGINEAKEELEEIIHFLRDPKKFTRLGGRIPKGVLLMGPPGTGKTLLARGVAGEAGVPFFSISGSDFVEMFVGVGASRVRDLFEQGKKNAPCIIFIDEIDAVGRHRGAGLGGGHDEREQTLNQLLVELDGFESSDGVIMIAATNRPDVLDPALLRPGRFDRRIVVNRPDVNGREKILQVHTRRTPLSKDVDLTTIARGTPGFSGADLESLVNEAALLAARKDRDAVKMEDFEEAKDKVLMGAARRSLQVSDKERKITAYHEAGHALVGKKLGHSDPIHKVTIIPRGRALGLTQTLPEEDRYNLTKQQALAQIAMLMGGRIAEELTFQHMSTGASHDFSHATEIARKMVCEWGMTELGPMTFGKREEQIFLGREINRQMDYSEKTAQEIDTTVRKIITDCYNRARKTLEDNHDSLVAVAEGLLEFETLTGAEIDFLMEGGSLAELKEKRVAGGTMEPSTTAKSLSPASKTDDAVAEKIPVLPKLEGENA
ncbi:MAG: ATP-dependent zinc metalloprotease FtsH [Myxococcales bacterium]|nr:ATP-dependent zinc metalloprotease FtsH [Myxococcales bacterium]